MSKSAALTIYTDGAARGNPGPAAFAYVIQQDGESVLEASECIGKTTNNQAEYTALVRALEAALQLGAHHHYVVHSDSELMVKQMNGEYRVKNAELRPLYEEACELRDQFAHRPRFVHVRREQNSRADALCNEALDGRPTHAAVTHGRSHTPAARTEKPAPPRSPVHTRAIACLTKAAAAWADGETPKPTPEDVWQQLWSILEAEGALHR